VIIRDATHNQLFVGDGFHAALLGNVLAQQAAETFNYAVSTWLTSLGR
jgi:hypothetical protein